MQIFDVLEDTFHFVFAEGDPRADIVKGFRSLRSLRLIAKLQPKIKPLKAMVSALAASMPAVISLVMCNMLIVFIFSLVAMEQFAGLFDACNRGVNRPSYSDSVLQLGKAQCSGVAIRPPSQYAQSKMWQQGVNPSSFSFPSPMTWSTKGANYQLLTFNSIGDCYKSFVNLLLRSQGGSVMESLVASTNRDEAPIRMSSPSFGIFLIVFQILLGVFVTQVVVGIIMTNLKMKSGLAYHTEEQMSWPATKEALNSIPSPFGGPREAPEVNAKNILFKIIQIIQVKCFDLLENWKFRYLLVATIIISIATQATTHFSASRSWMEITWWINLICLAIFTIEAVVSIIYDWRRYFFNAENVFDCSLTVLGIVELFLLPRFGMQLGLGSLRQLRLIRLFNNFDVFIEIKEALLIAIPEAGAVTILLAVVLFIFGCIGQSLFPKLKQGLTLSYTINFANIANSLNLLFIASSGAGGRDPKTSWGHFIYDGVCTLYESSHGFVHSTYLVQHDCSITLRILCDTNCQIDVY